MTSPIESTDSEIIIPEGAELIDDVFYVWETRYGLFSSMTKEGRKMLSGAIKDNVTIMTRWHLKCEQEGTLDLYSRVVGSSIIEGKL
jgi:hypothetical protein